MAYYFTQDRAYIMIIGFQYALFCLIMSSFCLSHTVGFLSDLSVRVLMPYMNDEAEKVVPNVIYFSLFFLISGFFYNISFRQNYQNY